MECFAFCLELFWDGKKIMFYGTGSFNTIQIDFQFPHVAQADLRLTVLLPQPPMCCNPRSMPQCFQPEILTQIQKQEIQVLGHHTPRPKLQLTLVVSLLDSNHCHLGGCEGTHL